MLQEAATVAAAGGTVGYWTYPLGNGAWVPSRMRRALAVRQFLKEREDLFLHSSSARWNAILVSDPSTPTFGGPGVEGAHKAMAALHRSVDIIDESALTDTLPYDLIVLPEQAFLDPSTAAQLKTFVRAGGVLLSSGASLRSPELQALLGVRSVRFGEVKDGHVLLSTSDEPTGVDSAWDKVELGVGAKELYPLYLSWDQLNFETRNVTNNWPMHGQLDEEHPEPAGFPAAITRRLGQGRIVHLCTGIFGQYKQLGDPQMLRWLREVVEFLQPQPRCQTNAPSWVDLSLRRGADGRLLAQVVNQTPGRDVARLNTDDTWVDEIPEVGPFTLALRLPRKPRAVTWEPGGRALASRFKGGVLTLEVPRFRNHGCVAVRE
jgi:hypothetical protein